MQFKFGIKLYVSRTINSHSRLRYEWGHLGLGGTAIFGLNNEIKLLLISYIGDVSAYPGGRRGDLKIA